MLEPTRSDTLAILMAVSAFLIALILYLSKNKKYKEKGNILNFIIKTNAQDKEALRKQLINMVLGDKKVATRLIAAERELRPQWPEQELIRLAIERLIRDRR